MKNVKTGTRRIFSVLTMAWIAVVVSPPGWGATGPDSTSEKAEVGITIVDQEGHVVPAAPVAPGTQTFDVTVGPGGALVFSPSTLNISAGDTVRWTWGSLGHSVTSGTSCATDSQYCSPNDTNCGAGVLSGAGAVYQHTFNQAGTYSYFCAAHCLRGMTGTINVAPACTPPPSGIVSWWPGDGHANDIQNGNHGSIQGGATYASGEVGLAFKFAANGFINIPYSPTLDPPSGQITVDAWVNPASLQGAAPFINKRTMANNTGYTLEQRFDNSGLVLWNLFIGGTSVGVVSSVVLPLNTWTHVAGTYDGTMSKLYFNGTIVGSALASGSIDPSPGAGVQLGRNIATGALFDGLIDEVEVFNRALGTPEIQAIFNAGMAGKCKSPVYMNTSSGEFGTFDLATGVFSVRGNSSALAGMAVVNGTLYGTSLFTGIGTLYTINPANGFLTTVGAVSGGYDTFGATPSGLFAVGTDSNLYSLSPTTGAKTLIGPTGFTFASEFRCLSNNSGTLYFADGANLYTLNALTGAPTLVGNMGGPQMGALLQKSGVLYGGEDAPGFRIDTLNPNTGATTIGPTVTGTSSVFYGLATGLRISNAASRKTHGGARMFDIVLPLTGSSGVECRSGGATGDHQLILTFIANSVTVNGSPQAQVTSGIGQVGTGGTPNGGAVSVNGSVVTVPLTNVANAQRIVVTISGISDGTNTTSVSVPMSFLLGDTNGNGTVNATDVGQTKAASGQPLDATNFRADINFSGSINASDIGLVKANAGMALPP